MIPNETTDVFFSFQESAFFLPYPHPTIVDMQYVSHVERAVASAMRPDAQGRLSPPGI